MFPAASVGATEGLQQTVRRGRPGENGIVKREKPALVLEKTLERTKEKKAQVLVATDQRVIIDRGRAEANAIGRQPEGIEN